MKIGITERGDASVDYSWLNKMDNIDGAVLITKNITDKFIEMVLPFYDKVIIHATVTGYGHSKLEPHVMSYQKSLSQISKLIGKGFPVKNIVLRIDPVIPTEKGIVTYDNVFREGYAIGIRRFKMSVLDMYPHVRKRFEEASLPLPYGPYFSASDEQFAMLDKIIFNQQKAYPDARIESCAEPKLKSPMPTGCIGNYDLKILGLKPESEAERGYQRIGCLCLSCKTELLNNKYRCKNGCLYCYWKDEELKTEQWLCSRCGGKMEPVMFLEHEYNKNNVPTGRVRRACSHLECTSCLKKETVDGDFLVGEWFRPN